MINSKINESKLEILLTIKADIDDEIRGVDGIRNATKLDYYLVREIVDDLLSTKFIQYKNPVTKRGGFKVTSIGHRWIEEQKRSSGTFENECSSNNLTETKKVPDTPAPKFPIVDGIPTAPDLVVSADKPKEKMVKVYPPISESAPDANQDLKPARDNDLMDYSIKLDIYERAFYEVARDRFGSNVTAGDIFERVESIKLKEIPHGKN